MNVTEEEFEEVANELSRRIKDMIYINLKDRLRNELKKIFKIKTIETDEPLKLTWTLRFVFGDIEQIIGRLRREKEAKK